MYTYRCYTLDLSLKTGIKVRSKVLSFDAWRQELLIKGCVCLSHFLHPVACYGSSKAVGLAVSVCVVWGRLGVLIDWIALDLFS